MTRLAVAGFVIWLAATIALRVAGQWLLRGDDLVSIVLLFAVSAPLMWALPRGLFARFAIDPADYARGAIVLVAPGMLLDTISTACFARVFPNIPANAAGLFGGWLLFCNVVALVSAASAWRRAGPGSPAVELRHG
jgi:Family of unknown function (DUF5367)